MNHLELSEGGRHALGREGFTGARDLDRSKAGIVKFTTTGAMPYQQAYISLTKIFPVMNNAFYGRMLIYTTKAPNEMATMASPTAADTPAVTSAADGFAPKFEGPNVANPTTAATAVPSGASMRP